MSIIEQAVIVAAGHGVSLGPLTKDRPKAMLPVLGKPIIIRIMDRMREAGIKHFIVIIDEHEGAIASYLNSLWVPDVKVQIVIQNSPRGVANALSYAAAYINGPFLFASCDNLTPVEHIRSVIQRFEQFRGDVVISLTTSNSGQTSGLPAAQFSEGYVTGFTDVKRKTRRDSSVFMLYACGKRLFDHLKPTNFSHDPDYEMVQALQGLMVTGGKVGYVNSDWHMRLVTELDLLTINKRFLREGRDTHILSEIPGTVHITPPVRIDPQVSVGRGAKLGPNVYLETGAHVGQEAVIWDSVILQRADVAAGEVLHGQIVARRARISE